MEKTRIDWADSTWNPVTGCKHECEYCYARRMVNRFGGSAESAPTDELHVLDEPYYADPSGWIAKDGESRFRPWPFGFDPTFHKYRLNEYTAKKGRNIFVCSMADLFGEWIPDRWIAEVMEACEAGPQHNYMFLTKNPARYIKLAYTFSGTIMPRKDNFGYGTTVTTKNSNFFHSYKYKTFLSIEPLLGRLGPIRRRTLDGINWVIIGAMTGPGSEDHQPDRTWVEEIVEACRLVNIPVFMKQNLAGVWGSDLIQERPAELIRGRGNE